MRGGDVPGARRLIQLTASLGLVGGATILAVVPGGAAVVGHSIAGDTPAHILSITKAATKSAGSFTVNCTAAAPSLGLTGTVTTNVGGGVGSQNTRQTVKSLGVGTVQTRFVGGVDYFKGNAVFLEIQFGVTNSKYANKWISVSKGQLDYAIISSGMTMASALLQIGPVAPLSKSKVETFAGKSAVAVIGKANPNQRAGTGSQHIFVAIASPNRPVGLSISTTLGGHAYHGTCTFTNWKHKFVVTKPSGSTPINKTGL
jgi:hypothetical protein